MPFNSDGFLRISSVKRSNVPTGLMALTPANSRVALSRSSDARSAPNGYYGNSDLCGGWRAGDHVQEIVERLLITRTSP
jgi:hypothetical protein